MQVMKPIPWAKAHAHRVEAARIPVRATVFSKVLLSLSVLTLMLTLSVSTASAQTTIASWNFDTFTATNWQGWSADNGVWAVGAPTNTSGPSPYNGESQCFSTGLTADYPTFGSGSSRLITPSITLPAVASGQSIVLGFDQWFQFGGSYYSDGPSYGDVEVSVWNAAASPPAWGAWTQVSRSIVNYSGGWSFSSVDLSAYAGQQIRVAFHQTAVYYSGAGWDLDGVSVCVAPDMTYPQTVDFDTFTPTNWQGWSADNGTWQEGIPTNGKPYNGGTQSASTSLNADYPTFTDSRFISPPVTLPAVPAGNSLELGFFNWFQLGGSYYSDGPTYGDVEVSAWNAASSPPSWGGWTQMSRDIVNYSGGWSFSSVDLSAYAGQRIRIAFHQNSVYYSGGGWWLDHVSLSTVPDLSPNQTVTFENFTATNWQGWNADNGVWDVGAPTVTFADSGLTNGTTYFYKIAGLSSAGTSAESDEASATPSSTSVQTGPVSPIPNPTPTAPNDLLALAGNATVYLSWPGSSGSTGYNVYRSTTAGGEGETPIGVASPAPGPGSAYEGTQCAATGLAGNYPTFTDSRLVTPAVTLPAVAAGQTIQMVFWQWFQFGGSYYSDGPSFGEVEVSVWNPTSSPPAWGGWTQLSENYTGNSTGWEYVGTNFPAVDLTAYAGQRIMIGFHTNNVYYSAAGWFVDNVTFVLPTPTNPTFSPTSGPVGTPVTLTGNYFDGATSVEFNGTSAAFTVASDTRINTTVPAGATTGPIAVTTPSGTGTSSTNFTVTAPPPPPTPTAIAGNAFVVLSWTASTGATSYNVYRSTISGAEGATAYKTGITTESYTDTGLTNGTTYYFTVAAVNNVGASAQSAQASATPEFPVPPTGLTATPGNAVVTLSWTASAGGTYTSYDVYSGTATGGESATPIATGVTKTAYTDTGLTNNITYYYKVAAVNGGGTSSLSAEASATPTAAPPVPTGLTAVAGTGEVTVSWTASAGATSYNVNWLVPTWTAYRLAKNTTTLTYTQTGLSNGTAYSFEVAAIDAGGTSPNSAPVTATPLATPAGLTATAGNTLVTLTWAASAGATGYNVYRGTATGGESATPVGTTTGTSYTDTGLTDGAIYYYKLAGINSNGTSTQSAEVKATPVFVAPSGLTATAGDTQVLLAWTGSPGATSYNIYRGTAAGGEATTAVGNSPVASYTDTSVTDNVTYYYKVAAVDAGGTSPLSNEAHAKPTALATTAGPTAGPTVSIVIAWTTNYVSQSQVNYGTSSTALTLTQSSTVLTTAHSVTLTGLTPGKVYYYQTISNDGVGTPLQSAVTSFTP